MLKELLQLYLIFVKLGSVTFGGGYAMYPLLQYEFVEKRSWLTEQELMDYYAIGQCTPGIIAVNVSTFVGDKRCGAIGGVVATLGFVTAPIILLAVIAGSLRRFSDYAAVRSAFAGVRVCVCVLIANTVLKMRKNAVVDVPTLVIFAAAFAASVASPYLPFRVTPTSIVITALVCGLLWRRGKGGR